MQLVYFRVNECWGVGHEPAHTNWPTASPLLLPLSKQCEQTWTASPLQELIPEELRVLVRYEFTNFALESIDYHIYKYEECV